MLVGESPDPVTMQCTEVVSIQIRSVLAETLKEDKVNSN